MGVPGQGKEGTAASAEPQTCLQVPCEWLHRAQTSGQVPGPEDPQRQENSLGSAHPSSWRLFHLLVLLPRLGSWLIFPRKSLPSFEQSSTQKDTPVIGHGSWVMGHGSWGLPCGNMAVGTPVLAGAQVLWAFGDYMGVTVGARPSLTKVSTLLPGKHPQEASLGTKRALGAGREQLEMQALASERPRFLSRLYYFLAV